MKKRFIFRNRECWYELNPQDVNNKVVHFTFAPTAFTNFIDDEGHEFFYVAIYNKTHPYYPLWFERNYEDLIIADCHSYFDDSITDKECDKIETFIKSLLDE